MRYSLHVDTEALLQKYLIKEYKHWLLSLSFSQGYLGRAVVWAKRADALELADATDEELRELREILSAYRRTLQQLFHTDWMNFAFLGNVDRHLHGHIIPRYSGERVFEGVTFSDPQWGRHYDPSRVSAIESPEDNPDLLVALRDALRQGLGTV